jgi:hypothetical protein
VPRSAPLYQNELRLMLCEEEARRVEQQAGAALQQLGTGVQGGWFRGFVLVFQKHPKAGRGA